MKITNKTNKIFIISLLLICLLFNYSCNQESNNNQEEPNNQEQEKQNQAIINPTSEMEIVEDYIQNKISHIIMNEDYNLPKTYNNITITWESLSPNTIDNEGKLLVNQKKITES